MATGKINRIPTDMIEDRVSGLKLSDTLLKKANGSSGTTASRPSNETVGYIYFDTTLGKPIWLKTTPNIWVDATGNVV